jgi:predicted ATPase
VLGGNARVVTEIIPQLELLIGNHPPIAALPPVQARNRLFSAFTNLFQVFAPKGEFLCLVTDDMQWADAASLSLLAHLFKDPGTSNIALVGSYRDNEVGASHPLHRTIASLAKARVDIAILQLHQIEQSDVQHLLRDTFDAASHEVEELAHVLHARTGGNPLYVKQLLHFLCDEGLIAFDFHHAKWTWDLARIREEGVTQDILDLLRPSTKRRALTLLLPHAWATYSTSKKSVSQPVVHFLRLSNRLKPGSIRV